MTGSRWPAIADAAVTEREEPFGPASQPKPQVAESAPKSLTRISNLDTIRALLTFHDPKQFLFFTRTPTGRQAGQQFLARLKERTQNRDKAISLRSYAAQLKAIHRWGLQQPSDLSVIHQPVLVANGDSDKMVPTTNSADLARRLPDSELVIYPDAGHGGIFQFHAQFVHKALEFLGG